VGGKKKQVSFAIGPQFLIYGFKNWEEQKYGKTGGILLAHGGKQTNLRIITPEGKKSKVRQREPRRERIVKGAPGQSWVGKNPAGEKLSKK